MYHYLLKGVGTESDSKLVCPRCGGVMDLEPAGDIEVDICTNCKGIWLDGGELEALQEKSSAEFDPNTAEKRIKDFDRKRALRKKR